MLLHIATSVFSLRFIGYKLVDGGEIFILECTRRTWDAHRLLLSYHLQRPNSTVAQNVS